MIIIKHVKKLDYQKTWQSNPSLCLIIRYFDNLAQEPNNQINPHPQKSLISFLDPFWCQGRTWWSHITLITVYDCTSLRTRYVVKDDLTGWSSERQKNSLKRTKRQKINVYQQDRSQTNETCETWRECRSRISFEPKWYKRVSYSLNFVLQQGRKKSFTDRARLTIKLDRLMIVSNQAFSASFCMYHWFVIIKGKKQSDYQRSW